MGGGGGGSRETGAYCRNQRRENGLEQSGRRGMVRSGLIVDSFEGRDNRIS